MKNKIVIKRIIYSKNKLFKNLGVSLVENQTQYKANNINPSHFKFINGNKQAAKLSFIAVNNSGGNEKVDFQICNSILNNYIIEIDGNNCSPFSKELIPGDNFIEINFNIHFLAAPSQTKSFKVALSKINSKPINFNCTINP